jgi:23S rRNA (pseudouridine1915-N3)-methyltransferase
MKITLIYIGKTDEKCMDILTEKYINRLKAFISLNQIIITDIKNVKNISKNEQKNREGGKLLEKIKKTDYVVLLDEKGKEFTSVEFAGYLQKRMNTGIKNLVFIIGGPYGFSESVYKRANQQLALSKMTFSHQLIRLIFAEQLYRAFTILNNHPYHHE